MQTRKYQLVAHFNL